ncbi:MAG: plasmid pRiA4b ORF-3 family protein [Pirellulales bacterium]|nr:plasmid pRiA4b ORF-3 family protein [Pirellulales bacterium]
MATRRAKVQQETLQLKLTATERKLLVEPSFFLPEKINKLLDDTPARKPLSLTEEELDEFADCLGAMLGHYEDEGDDKFSRKLERLLDKVETLLADEEDLAGASVPGDVFDQLLNFDVGEPGLDFSDHPSGNDDISPTKPVAHLVLNRQQREVVAGMDIVSDDVRKMMREAQGGEKSFALNLRQAMVLALAIAEKLYIGCSPGDAACLEQIGQKIAQACQATLPTAMNPAISSGTPASLDTYYQLKITLDRSKPPIWRRVRVADCTLEQLHYVIQDAMGWENCHMHSFRVDNVEFGTAEMDDYREVRDEGSILLSDIVERGTNKFRYWYDFGDDWWHPIRVESTHDRKPDEPLAVCTKGKQACPPEDCGGIWGYYAMLETINDPEAENHEEIMEWLGGPIDPEAFDLAEVNERLARYSES